MSVIALITELTQQDIRLWLEDGQLRFSAPKGGMNEATRELLKTNKNAIIHFLSRSQAATLPAIGQADKSLPQPLSFAQERFWFLGQLEPGNTALHLSLAITLHGPLDTAILQRVLNTIIERHSILRTAYMQTAEGTFQHIIANPHLQLRQQVCGHLSAAEIQAIADSEAAASFNLEAGDVVHPLLLNLPDNHFVLLCTIHHIATDGWSMSIIGSEIAALYEAFSLQQASPLPEPAIQYIDFAVWQRQQQRAALQRQLAYWQQQLANIPGLQLPADFTRTANPPNQGGSFRFLVNPQLSARLHDMASTHHTTLFVVLLGLFSTLLYRYTQQNCFCIGTAVAGRNQSATESVLGCFLNMLALKAEHQPHSTFSDVINHYRQTTQDAFNNQNIPFEEVVKAVVNNRNLSITPLFQVMFDLHNIPQTTISHIGDIAIGYHELEKNGTLYDLSLHAQDTPAGITAEFEYKTALFTKNTIQTLASHFIALTESVINQPQQAIGTLAYLTPQEQQQQIVQWNNTARLRPTRRYLHHYIEQQAAATPEAIALRFYGNTQNGNTLNYRAMNNMANRFARYLQTQGISCGAYIGVYMQRSLYLPVVLLAILKTGAAYLPLDTGFPPERLASIASHAQLPWIITDSADTAWAIPGNIRQITFAAEGEWQNMASDNIVIADHNTDKPLLNIIYTSGSTGEPKGVMVSHAAIINRLLWMQETFPLHNTDAVLQKTPYSFDVSVWELFWPLMHGAILVIAEPDGHKNPAYLHEAIAANNITVVHFVPSLLGVFLATQTAAEKVFHSTSLQRVFCSGETLSPALASAFHRQYPATELVNLYGPTEAAIDVSYHLCVPQESRIPLGKPISNIELYLLDQQQQLLPVGATGEICIAGSGLAEGYLHQPELSAQVFIPNPFCQPLSNHTTLYRTGDMARFDHDGNLHFLGRFDQQVKIRGLRIELGDIESCLNRHEDIRECLLTVREYNNQQQLVAYYIAHRPVEPQTLRHFLAEQLPGFMLPNALVELAAWPFSYNGKIDRHALPEPRRSNIATSGFVAARNSTEATIAAIWAELLGIDSIGIYDNFFEAGGHSLLATIAISRMQNAFGIKIPLAPVFQEPTIANCANIIALAMQTPSVLASVTTPAGDDEEEVTL